MNHSKVKEDVTSQKNQVREEEIQEDPIEEKVIEPLPKTRSEINIEQEKLPDLADITQKQYERVKNFNKLYEEKVINDTFTENRKEDTIKQPSAIEDIDKAYNISHALLISLSSKISDIAEKNGIQIEKSEKLAKDWEEHTSKMKKFYNSLGNIDIKKTLKYIAIASSVVSVIYFIFQMGLAGKVFDAIHPIGKIVPLPDIKPEDVSKEEISTLTQVIDTPITASPLTIVTTVGTLVTLLAITKGVLWVVRKLKK